MRSGTLLFLCGMLAISCVRVERAFADQLHSEALHSRKPGALLRSSRPQIAAQITWMYAHSLEDGANFLGETLQLEEVPGLAQKEICRIFHAAADHYLGVCNSRVPPNCSKTGGPEGSDPTPVTYTFIVDSEDAVNAWHEFLSADAVAGRVNITAPGGSTKFMAYAFNFYDTNQDSGLGCYRFEVQYFTDPSWPRQDCPPI